MKTIFLFVITFSFCVLAARAQSAAPDTHDNQFWNETQLSIPITRSDGKPKLSFLLNGNLRFGGNISRFADERIGFGFEYKLNKHITLTPSYIYIGQQPQANAHLYESRLRFAVGLENRWKMFSIDDRNLIEYRFRNNLPDSTRYRNKLRFIYPVKKGDKELFAPFAANEVYYDLRAKTFSRNELSLGVTRKLKKNLSADFFYLWQANKTGSPRQLNVVGVNLKLKLD
jgi:Protein of unknown function (DUF2490)